MSIHWPLSCLKYQSAKPVVIPWDAQLYPWLLSASKYLERQFLLVLENVQWDRQQLQVVLLRHEAFRRSPRTPNAAHGDGQSLRFFCKKRNSVTMTVTNSSAGPSHRTDAARRARPSLRFPDLILPSCVVWCGRHRGSEPKGRVRLHLRTSVISFGATWKVFIPKSLSPFRYHAQCCDDPFSGI
jgi:hypothetical protein